MNYDDNAGSSLGNNWWWSADSVEVSGLKGKSFFSFLKRQIRREILLIEPACWYVDKHSQSDQFLTLVRMIVASYIGTFRTRDIAVKKVTHNLQNLLRTQVEV